MEYTFASERKLTFIVEASGGNKLVDFGDRNENGISIFVTHDANVAKAIRRNALSRRGIIRETTQEIPLEAVKEEAKAPGQARNAETQQPAAVPGKPVTPKIREFDNYTVAREMLCKEFNVAKSQVRNPTALARLAQEHSITIKYKEL